MRGMSQLSARDHKRNTKATRKTKLSPLHTQSRIIDYEMHAMYDMHMAMRNVYSILLGTPHTNNFFRSPPSWLDLKLCGSVEWIVLAQNTAQKGVL